MGKQANRAYLEAIRGSYPKADRAGKAKILNEFCAVCGYNRKYAIRLAIHPSSSRVLREISGLTESVGAEWVRTSR